MMKNLNKTNLIKSIRKQVPPTVASAGGFGRMVGGIISAVRDGGGSFPAIFCCISHIARENCSELSLPVCFMSHRFLK